MRAHRILSAIAGLAAIGFASVLVVSPAAASPATLPVGQQITVVEQIPGDGPEGSRMWTASPVDAVLTDNKPVQAAVFVQAIDVNDDGIGYATEDRFNSDTLERTTYLWKANANTGELTDPVQIVAAALIDLVFSECNGLDLQPDGTIVLACTSNAINGNPLNGFLGVVTPGGVFTVHFNSQVQEDVPFDFTAVAYNAVTGELWAFVDDSAAFLVNRSAEPWVLGNVIPLGQDVDGADFDSSGQLFVTDASDGTELQTLDLTVVPGTFNLIGLMRDGIGNVVSPVLAITIWGEALPATGPAEIVPIGLGTALLFLAGAAFIATGRIGRRSA